MDIDRQIVTFLFTDIEESTGLWEKQPTLMPALLARHNALIRTSIEVSGGRVFKTVGDSFCASFDSVGQAARAAIEAQCALLSEPWGDYEIRVRMAIHIGMVTARAEDFEGVALSRVSRLLSLGYGRQILISEAAHAVGVDDLPTGCNLRNLGIFRLRGLERHEQVYQLLHPDLPSAFPPPKQTQETPTNLPLPVSSFVGREQELNSLRDVLFRTRVLTITGSGGSGKTRLAMQLAADSASDHPHGVWYVDLADVAHDYEVAVAAANALLLRVNQGDAIETIVNSTLLIILDNCEKVRKGCRDFAGEIVQTCSRVRIVATSREPIRIRGEQIMTVPPLTLPEQTGMAPERMLLSSSAVRLFVERAAAVSTSFRLHDKNAEEVAEICRRLDGIPLAIELIAARARVLSPRDLLRRIDRSLSESKVADDGGLSRHSTMQAAIDWSYTSLSPLSQELLIRLTVFKGGWTLDAAEEVCSDHTISADQVLDELSNTVEKSLVSVSDNEEETRRFAFLEIIRSYVAARREVESGLEIARRHAVYYRRLAQENGYGMSGNASVEALSNLDRERGNMLASFDHFIAVGEYTSALEMAESLWQFWVIRGHLNDGADRVKKALGTTSETSVVRAKVMMGAGVLFSELGDYASAESYYSESAKILRMLNDTSSLAASLGNFAVVKQHQQQFEEARELYLECLAIYRMLNKDNSVALVLGNLGLLRCLEGAFVEAEADLYESLRLSRANGMARSSGVALGNIGLLYYLTNRLDEAKVAYSESLSLFYDLGDKGGIASGLDALARVAASKHSAGTAVELAAAAERLRNEIGLRTPAWIDKLTEEARELITLSLEPAQVEAHRRIGRALSVDEAKRLAEAC